MPVIFTRPVGTQGGGAGRLGTPSDGAFDDGLLDLTPGTTVADSVDDINEILRELAPEAPKGLDGTSLVPSRSFHTGKLPAGLSTRWYLDNKSPGDTVDRILEYQDIELDSADSSERFSRGSEGFLVAESYLDGLGISEVARLDIEANFDKSVVGPDVQDLSAWDNQGSGDPCTDGIVTFSGGSLQVTHCGWHNNFNKWQRMNAKINALALKEGYNAYRLKHEIGPQSESTQLFKLWYDDDTNALTFAVAPDLVENTISSNKYISGVRYYSVGDTFDISYVADNVYRKCYHVSNVSRYRFDGQSTEVIVNPVTVPNYNDSLSVAHTIVIDRVNFYTIDGRLTVAVYHPWKSSVSAVSPSHNILICTYGDISTNKHEYFLDEYYRLPIGNYDSVPVSIINQWDSQSPLSNGNALVFNQRVQYPTQDFTSYWPSGNPDYSGFTGVQKYVRAFSDTNAHNNVVLTLAGIDLDSIGPFGVGDVNIAIKLPTQTGWMDAGKYYMSGSFAGINNDGCLVSKEGQDLHLTFGTFSTANSGYMIIVEIRFLNSNSVITEMSVNW